MTQSSCPILDLQPILEGQPPAAVTRAVQSNFARLMEWARKMCKHIAFEIDVIDGGSP